MGRLILFDLVSLDGFFEAPGHGISWHSVDDEFDRLAIEQLDAAGCLVFGRVTYELMASFWPSEQGMREDPEVARRMNALPKVVFSRTLRSAGWENTAARRWRRGGGDGGPQGRCRKGDLPLRQRRPGRHVHCRRPHRRVPRDREPHRARRGHAAVQDRAAGSTSGSSRAGRMKTATSCCGTSRRAD